MCVTDTNNLLPTNPSRPDVSPRVHVTFSHCGTKVRLWWFGAVLQGSCKFVLFLLSINTLRRTIFHLIAEVEGYIMI